MISEEFEAELFPWTELAAVDCLRSIDEADSESPPSAALYSKEVQQEQYLGTWCRWSVYEEGQLDTNREQSEYHYQLAGT